MPNHRADKRAVPRRRPVDVPRASDPTDRPVERRSVSTAGKRRGTPATGRSTHGGLRKTVFTGISSAPTLIGATALVLAAAGAITVSSPDTGSRLASGSVQRLSGQASVLSGASSIGVTSSLSNRARAVSRDSQRAALQVATDQSLQAAVEKQAKRRNAALASLAASARKQASLIAARAWQLPVASGAYQLTSRFGECSGLWSHCHTGLDFAAPSGTPVHAVAGGTVTKTGSAGAYGNQTIVTLEDGTELWYCHQTTIGVSPGQQVRAGEVIGTVGSTGNTTGAHLHLEVRPGAGDPVDPFAALVAHGIHP